MKQMANNKMSDLINLIIKTADKFDEAGLENEADALDLLVKKIMIKDPKKSEEGRSGG